MARIRHKLQSWEDGRDFMKKVSKLTGLEVYEIEEYLKCENNEISVSCHLKFDGKSFVLIKTENQEIVDEIKKLI